MIVGHDSTLLTTEGVEEYIDRTPAWLIEQAILRGEGALDQFGSLVVNTGIYTGRSPQDKYFIDEESSRHNIRWGSVNHPLSNSSFDSLLHRVTTHLKQRDFFTQHLFAGADPHCSLPVKVVTEQAWQSLFIRQLLIRTASPESWDERFSSFTILCVPSCHASPEEDGTRSETFIAIHLGRRIALIGGTNYAGEIKKCVFSILNYLLPQQGIFPMHCAANIGSDGDSALFFGLSGTGKTTLSTDPKRRLIGDDEHGWSDTGVFNFEGGCYAKCIGLNATAEPQIWKALRFGSVLENVEMDDKTRIVNFNSSVYTENTRAAYPLDHIENSAQDGMGAHPKHIFFLTADAFGTLPPISRLTTSQALYYFLSGYTSKVAGTERGLGMDPQAAFSACFGEPFLPLAPIKYAEMLAKKLIRHKSQVWLVNTGWVGGPFGVGHRIPLACTRALLTAALNGDLENAAFRAHPIFKLQMPESVPGAPQDILDPRSSWKRADDYDRSALELASRFHANFTVYQSEVSEEIATAGP